ncbi:MAG: alpha/beta hydrolase [Actinobacteria bacterium]|nr:alpha/beta hydrolase [Actinomycetota bacterium]
MPLEPRVRRIVGLMNLVDRGGDDVPIDVRRRVDGALARRGAVLVMPKGPAPASTVDHLVPVRDGRIRVRVHRPVGTGPFPAYVFLHGGGWCVGTIEERDPRCRQIVAGARCVVVSVDYRMAPENAFPTPAEDCYSALEWVATHAAELDVDPTRLAVGGESAGANLAAVVCLMARDRSGPPLVHQWLDVPATDVTLSQPSFEEVPDGYLLDRSTILRFRELYLGDLDRVTDPYVSPLLADLRDLPPAWIMSAEYDKLRDDGRAYARALEAAGVQASFRLLEGHVHPSFAFTRWVPSARAYEADAIAALARAFAR